MSKLYVFFPLQGRSFFVKIFDWWMEPLTIEPLGGWYKGVQRMYDSNGLLDVRWASLRA